MWSFFAVAAAEKTTKESVRQKCQKTFKTLFWISLHSSYDCVSKKIT